LTLSHGTNRLTRQTTTYKQTRRNIPEKRRRPSLILQ